MVLPNINDWQFVFLWLQDGELPPVTDWFNRTMPATLLFVPIMSRLHKLSGFLGPASHDITSSPSSYIEGHCAPWTTPTNTQHTSSPLTSPSALPLHSWHSGHKKVETAAQWHLKNATSQGWNGQSSILSRGRTRCLLTDGCGESIYTH